jgi:hypothetical protein
MKINSLENFTLGKQALSEAADYQRLDKEKVVPMRLVKDE